MTQWQRNLWTMFAATAVNAVGFAAFYAFVPLYVQELGVREPGAVAVWAGIISGASSITFMVAAPLWGGLADRYGRKMMVIRAVFANAAVIACMGLVGNVEQLLVLRLVQGCLTGFSPATAALVSTGSPKDRLGYALGMVSMASYVGSALGPMFGGVIADQAGFRPVFFVMGLSSFLTGMLVVLFVKEDFHPAEGGAEKTRESAFTGLGRLTKQRELLAMAAVMFMLQFSLFVISPVLPLYVGSLGAPANRVATVAGSIVGLGGIVSAGAAATVGLLADRFGQRGLLMACTAGAGLAYLLQAMAGSVLHLYVLRVPIGFCTGGLMPVSNALISRITRSQERASAFGLVTSAGSLGHIVGPMAGGAIAAATSMRAVFVVTALFMFAIATVVGVAVRGAPAEGGEPLATAAE